MRLSRDHKPKCQKWRGAPGGFLSRREGSATVEYALLISLIGGGILAGALALGSAVVDGLSAGPTQYLGSSDSGIGSHSGGSGGGAGSSEEDDGEAGSSASAGGGDSANGGETGAGGGEDGSSGVNDQSGGKTFGDSGQPGQGRENACENAAANSRACGG